jgi:alpha/beta superfamily hydrolase
MALIQMAFTGQECLAFLTQKMSVFTCRQGSHCVSLLKKKRMHAHTHTSPQKEIKKTKEKNKERYKATHFFRTKQQNVKSIILMDDIPLFFHKLLQ